MEIQTVLKKFLLEKVDPTKPVLLALSGGPDSMALFHLLKELSMNFGIAHVNHNWRAESQTESEILNQMANEANLPFHLKNLDPSTLQGNLELACRLERLKFFKEICLEFSYQAVIVGHHQDDQAETLLKRLFEGAPLMRLTGLKKVTVIDGLTIFRPFLDLRKKEIEAYLEEKKLLSFSDETNKDPKFMRARFRTQLIPYLSKEFGKDISAPLNRLGVESQEFNDYLEEIFKGRREKIIRNSSGILFDFSEIKSPFEIKHFIRKLTEEMHFSLSHAQIQTACTLIMTSASNKMLFKDGKKVIFDRKKMFIEDVLVD